MLYKNKCRQCSVDFNASRNVERFVGSRVNVRDKRTSRNVNARVTTAFICRVTDVKQQIAAIESSEVRTDNSNSGRIYAIGRTMKECDPWWLIYMRHLNVKLTLLENNAFFDPTSLRKKCKLI